jgi:hypothetical protein
MKTVRSRGGKTTVAMRGAVKSRARTNTHTSGSRCRLSEFRGSWGARWPLAARQRLAGSPGKGGWGSRSCSNVVGVRGAQTPLTSLLKAIGPGGGNAAAQPAVDVKSLHAKIGELMLENDFLEGALNKAGLLSAKR